jgi:hypothetical protein
VELAEMSDFGEYLRKLGTADPGEQAVGDIIPLARNAQGNLHLALPESVRSLLRGVADANVAGQQGVPLGQTASPDLTNMVLGLGGGAGAAFGPKAVGDEAISGIFAGRRAIPAEKRSQVGPLMKAGYGPEEIYDKTGGVFVGTDSAPRIEIPDPAQVPRLPYSVQPDPRARFQHEGTMKVPSEGTRVGDVIDHPALFNVYPELAGMNMKPMPLMNVLGGTQGAYDDATRTLYLSQASPKDIYSTIIHELQHGVQHLEGHSSGGNQGEFFTPEMKDLKKRLEAGIEPWNKRITAAGANYLSARTMLERVAKKDVLPSHTKDLYRKELDWLYSLTPEEQQSYKQAVNESIGADKLSREAYQMYHALAGETEARNAQRRIGGAHMAPPENPHGWQTSDGDMLPPDLAKYPWLTEDVPRDQQMIWTADPPAGETDVAKYLLQNNMPVQGLDQRAYEILKHLK